MMAGRAVIYTRISSDPDDLQAGVNRQETDCRELAKRLGWKIAHVFAENNESAFKRKTVRLTNGKSVQRVVRPVFKQMLDDLSSGLYNALIFYDLDRIARDPRDLEDLIDAKESIKFEIRSVTGDMRLDSDNDITMARVLVAMANKSSRDTSRRVARAAQQRAQDGEWHGGRPPFGYETILGADGKVQSLSLHAEHCAWVRDAANRILAGESVYGICSEWNRLGRSTQNDKPWTPRTLTRILTAPAVAAHREAGNGSLHQCDWIPVLDKVMWLRMVSFFSDQSRKVRTFPVDRNRKYMLSGIVRCSSCDRLMGTQVRSKAGPIAYGCVTGLAGGCSSRRIAMEPLEVLIAAAVFAATTNEALDRYVTQMHEAQAKGNTEEGALLQERSDLNARLLRINDMYEDGSIIKPDAAARRQSVQDRRQQVEARLEALSATDRRALIPRGAELQELWGVKDDHWRRSIIDALISNITVDDYPKNRTTYLSRRKDESEEDHSARNEENYASALAERVHITWRI